MTWRIFELFMWGQLVATLLCAALLGRWAWPEFKRGALWWLTARLPVKVIPRDKGAPESGAYVEWYHLCTVGRIVRVQIHRFLESDPDGLHDHPWSWARTFLLLGWYFEERRDRTRRRTFGYGLDGDTFHRVHLPAGSREVWSLFIFGPYTKAWGFLRLLTRNADHHRDVYFYEPRGRARMASGAPHAFDPWPATAPKGRDRRALQVMFTEHRDAA